MFASRNLSPLPRRPFSRPASLLLIGFLAWSIRDGLCAPPSSPCKKPPALATRLAHPDPQTWIELGNWFGDHQQFDCAQQAFRSGLRLDPDSAQLNYLLGLSFFESQDFDKAIPPLQQSVHGDPTVLKPHLLLASIYTRLARPDDADAEWRAALQIDPSSDMALHGLSDSLMAQENFEAVIALLRPAKLDENLALDLAVAYSHTGMPLDAIDVVSHALEASPTSIKLSNALVNAYLKVSRTLDAEHAAEKAYNDRPDDISVQTSYLRTLVINGDWGPAKPLGAKLLAEAPHEFDTLYLNGVMERQSGDYAAARDHLTEAISINPNQASSRENLGMALSRLNDPAGAKTQLQMALQLGSPEPETHFELAKALRALGETDAATQEMARYQQAVKDSNNTTVAVSKSGEAAQALNKGDTQRAIQLYREAFNAAPQNALIGYRLATALDQAGDTSGEHDVLEQVVAIDPTISLAQNQLGYLDSQRGDYASAEKHFRQAVSSAPAFTQAWISLAATLGVESKFPEAEDAVASALRIDPRNTEAQQLQHDLAAAKNRLPQN
jgi:tetratricopeptide (TPR) repeat protein